ncbi:hypothetical protein F4553_005254 [Allocatelliglobosispora scoriae]|uniref:Uncharacterized protein n=1 Tax=Allocatelliglobosispora scoriae TaxID=643052 RepID=A0A841BW22_9ACTN|nr:hypothetical protein [Allocatelliglobosispora scoriae]MBB5871875.1 hypothetical protein [Allocatelliglobosispora scoriae]
MSTWLPPVLSALVTAAVALLAFYQWSRSERRELAALRTAEAERRIDRQDSERERARQLSQPYRDRRAQALEGLLKALLEMEAQTRLSRGLDTQVVVAGVRSVYTYLIHSKAVLDDAEVELAQAVMDAVVQINDIVRNSPGLEDFPNHSTLQGNIELDQASEQFRILEAARRELSARLAAELGHMPTPSVETLG